MASKEDWGTSDAPVDPTSMRLYEAMWYVRENPGMAFTNNLLSEAYMFTHQPNKKGLFIRTCHLTEDNLWMMGEQTETEPMFSVSDILFTRWYAVKVNRARSFTDVLTDLQSKDREACRREFRRLGWGKDYAISHVFMAEDQFTTARRIMCMEWKGADIPSKTRYLDQVFFIPTPDDLVATDWVEYTPALMDAPRVK